LKYHPKEEKQRRIADETLQIYMPIAKRLGLYYFQQLLENGAFSILYPKEFAEISEHLEKQFPHQQDIIERGIEKIKSIIQEAEIPFLDVK
jgi:GTP pyrophosphokinase